MTDTIWWCEAHDASAPFGAALRGRCWLSEIDAKTGNLEGSCRMVACRLVSPAALTIERDENERLRGLLDQAMKHLDVAISDVSSTVNPQQKRVVIDAADKCVAEVWSALAPSQGEGR